MQNIISRGFEDNLIRLHPSDAGKTIPFNRQLFQGISPDIFIGLDRYDPSSAYQITRKFNISLQINPALWSSDDFFKYFTQGKEDGSDPFESNALESTKKCDIHGDDDSNLHAHSNLTALLTSELKVSPDQKGWGFNAGGVDYEYHSIGVATNKAFGPVGDRKTSHFEIKFQRQSFGTTPQELLCLNIHLSPTQKAYGKEAAIERLTQGIKLFYAELGLFGHKYVPQSSLLPSLNVTLDNYASKGFSCQNSSSLKVLDARNKAALHTKPGENTLNIWDLINNPVISSKSHQSGNEIRLEKRKQKKLRKSANQNNGFFDVIPDKNKVNVSDPEAIIPSFAT